MNRLARRLATVAAAATMVTPALALPAVEANASVPAISSQAFGMHWLNTGHPYPAMPFGTARIWDMGVTWKDLQPNGPTPVYSTDILGNTTQTGWSPAAWDQNALSRLDAIVSTFLSHHVDPIITLGMTPDWAADTTGTCHHVDPSGYDWGLKTCAPQGVPADPDPWSTYVTFLASRYQSRVHYFETWNEPSLMNGYNDDPAKLAAVQDKAYGILHSYGDKLISPGIPFTNGSAANGSSWLQRFLGFPGGRSYDITGVHLYPNDTSVRGGYGPEWSINTGLVYAKKALSAYPGLTSRPIWDTEHNVGRRPAHTGYFGTVAGASAVARTFVLATESHIARTVWYGADDRYWGGTWLENSDYRTLSTAGIGERTVRNLLVGKAALGCSQPKGVSKGRYLCRFGTTTGHRTLLVIWTTGAKSTYYAPAGTKYYYTVTGVRHAAAKGHKFTITGTPVYIGGSFSS